MRGLTRDNVIVGGIALAMVAAAVVFVHVPASRKLDRARNGIATEETALVAKADKTKTVPELQRQINAMRSKHKNFDRRLPRRQELGEFLRQISESVVIENLTDQVIEPGQPLQEDLYHTLPIVLRFQGSYLALARFLERIDQAERLARVQKLSIATKPGESLLDVTVQLNIYFTES